MIDLYTWNTPNGRKAAIMLEEIHSPYALKAINISTGAQKQADFLAINPNGRIPAIYDHSTHTRVFESGAILIYLAEKSGMFLPNTTRERAEVMSWLFWQGGGLGPMLGQYNHFSGLTGEHSYALNRYQDESLRLLGVINNRLEENEFLAGSAYSIADIMNYPWVETAYQTLLPNKPDTALSLPALQRWKDTIAQRPQVITGMKKLAALSTSPY